MKYCPNVRFFPFCEDSEMDNDHFDEDDTDQEDSGEGGDQGGHYESRNCKDPFESNSGDDPGGQGLSDGAGGIVFLLIFSGASNGAAYHRTHVSKLAWPSDEHTATSHPFKHFQ